MGISGGRRVAGSPLCCVGLRGALLIDDLGRSNENIRLVIVMWGVGGIVEEELGTFAKYGGKLSRHQQIPRTFLVLEYSSGQTPVSVT